MGAGAQRPRLLHRDEKVFELIDQARADEAGDADSGQAKGARMRPVIRGPGAGPWLPR